jgi:hypothetical protein
MNSFQFSIVVASMSTSIKMRIDSAFEFGTIMYGAVVAGRDMLMKGAGKDCTSLFSILITMSEMVFCFISLLVTNWIAYKVLLSLRASPAVLSM